MRTRAFSVFIAALMVTSSGCILSRLTDRAFIGFTSKRPSYKARTLTGLFILPFAAAVDLATLPIQALLVVILGDNFPFGEEDAAQTIAINLATDPSFSRLSQDKQQRAIKALLEMRSKVEIAQNDVLALTAEGEWVALELTDEAQAQILARAAATQTAAPQLACVP
jgi:hypothetical protein